ncbi:undecaprenyl-diphosphate phosphatase [Marinagarivorans algicola]|uniref:undecaprenyl-diphosphate phosphatase n=1 Tax=Marinagarivorans algicola TaxID=1513270 RepID=UPI0006B3FFC0|nr:undecaprenyl-diphosphate phosphatase [Marinagarivorans algicola]
MDLLQTLLLALIQGITEFLPISSSAHLILPSQVLGWPDQGLAFDVAVHLGTLIAVVVYFRRDITVLLTAWCGQFAGRVSDHNTRLAWFIIAATIPAGLAGLLFKDLIEVYLRSSLVIALTTLVFGALLWFADVKNQGAKTLAQFTLKAAIIIGCAQALALIPGTSRSGITITAALLLGFSREDSARFSFLLSIPIIVLSAGLMSLDLLEAPSVDWQSLAIGTVVSGLSAYACIYYFLAFINRLGMLPFVVYRLILGCILLFLSLS